MTRAAGLVLKLGGELLEDPRQMEGIARPVVRLARRTRLVVVHGGGREIDAALAQAGIAKRQVDGLRVTDEPTLGVVVSVLAGAVNTRLVAAVTSAGGSAVGLTGADARIGLVRPAPPHVTTDGRVVDLERVGLPIGRGRPRLLEDLCARGYIPIVASIGIGHDGRLFNVNADTLAAHLAARLRARRLVIAGGTPGVLDGAGRTIPRIDPALARRLIADGHASAGMVAKLGACREALSGGVREVVLVDGRDAAMLARVVPGRATPAACTQVIP